jgi:hypothetical protein
MQHGAFVFIFGFWLVCEARQLYKFSNFHLFAIHFQPYYHGDLTCNVELHDRFSQKM